MSFRFAQITDSHLYARMPEDDRDRRDRFFRSMWQEVLAHDVDLVVHTGDFVDGGRKPPDHERFRDLARALANEAGVGYAAVRGNHDATPNMPDAEYERVHGEGTFLFHHKGWAFLGVDRYYRCYEHTQHAYAMSPETIARVEKCLAGLDRNTPLVVMLHDDPIGVSRFHRGPELMHRLEGYNVQLLLFGHVQATYLGGYRGIPFVTVTGDDRPHDTSPLNYHIVTCRDDGRAVCDVYPIETNTTRVEASPLGQATAPRVEDGEEWGDLRGPRGDRTAEATLPGEAPTLAWSANLDGGFGTGAPKLADGKLVVATLGHGRYEHCAVHALDVRCGEAVWRAPVDGCVEGQALVADGTVYCGTSAGTLYALDLADGTPRWHWNNADNMPIGCQPILHEGILHCGANWEMYAVDAERGDVAWRAAATPNGFPYMGPGAGSPVVMGERVFHQRPFNAPKDGQGTLQSVRRTDGRRLKLVPNNPQMHPMQRHASPVTRDGWIYAVAAGLFVVDPEAPDAVHAVAEHAPGSATPCVAGQRAYVSYHDEIVAYALEGDGPRALWRTPHEPARYHFADGRDAKWGDRPSLGAFAAPLLCGDRLLVADLGGRLRALDVESGEEAWRLTLPEPVLSAPIVSGNALFVCGYFGGVYALAW